MKQDEINWLNRLKVDSKKYIVKVDNDCVSVVDIKANECVFQFNNYGQYFIVDILNYIGVRAEEE